MSDTTISPPLTPTIASPATKSGTAPAVLTEAVVTPESPLTNAGESAP